MCGSYGRSAVACDYVELLRLSNIRECVHGERELRMIGVEDHQPPDDAIMPGVVAAIRAAAKGALPEHVRAEHSFLLDLGFDSMSIAVLGLALEDQFDRAVLLDGWIAQHSEPAQLTVGSLCDYLRSSL